MTPPRPAMVRFFEKIAEVGTCWIWTGTLNGGYAFLWDASRGGNCYAHRWAYEMFVGPISEGHQVDHLCRRPACVNPAHLEATTMLENNHRRRSEACGNGHPWTEENTYRRPGDGGRTCRRCVNAAGRRYRQRRKAPR